MPEKGVEAMKKENSSRVRVIKKDGTEYAVVGNVYIKISEKFNDKGEGIEVMMEKIIQREGAAS